MNSGGPTVINRVTVLDFDHVRLPGHEFEVRRRQVPAPSVTDTSLALSQFAASCTLKFETICLVDTCDSAGPGLPSPSLAAGVLIRRRRNR
jgi:hypothetical protein